MNFITFTFSDKLIIKDSLLLSVTSNLQQLTFQKILNSILQSPFFKIQKVKISSNNKLLNLITHTWGPMDPSDDTAISISVGITCKNLKIF